MRLVLVHGFAQSSALWDKVRGHLPDTVGSAPLDVVAVDVADGREFAATAREIVDQCGPAVYCGYSMGGRLCLRAALDAPDVVGALVLVSASPGIADDTARAARAAADNDLAADARELGVEEFLRRWQAQPMFSAVPFDPGELARRAAATSIDRIAHQLQSLGQGTQVPLWDRLHELSMPVTVVTGIADAKYAAIGDEMAAAISACGRVRIDGGHALVQEQPVEIARVLVDAVGDATGHEPTS